MGFIFENENKHDRNFRVPGLLVVVKVRVHGSGFELARLASQVSIASLAPIAIKFDPPAIICSP